MRESGVLLDVHGNPLFWHNPIGRSGAALPDSRGLWEIMWENRDIIAGFAHSHPGSGLPGPSHEDVTTFAAIEAALGRKLDWWIITADNCCFVRWVGPDRLSYRALPVRQNMPWADRLRHFSGYSLREATHAQSALNQAAGILDEAAKNAGVVVGNKSF